MTHPTNQRFRAKLFLPLLACTAVAWLFRDPIRTGVALLVAGTGLATESVEAAPQSRGSFNGFNVSNATIPTSEILSGGPGRDGIPSIDKPKFVRPSAANFMLPDDLEVSVTIGDKTRAYALRILVWHEIVNDDLAGQPIAVTYCPLCGTAMVFNRQIGNRTLVFGVSGLLHNSDVLMYDRQTDSLWSQLAMKSVSGPQVNTELEWLASEHLTWAAWREKYPQGEVLSTQTGAQRNYSGSAYASYEQSPDTMFPVPPHRTELPKKEWVVGVIVDGIARAYPLRSLAENQTVRDQVNTAALEITFDPVSQQAVVKRAESGDVLPNVKVYWFAWQAFYPETGLWKP
ncbi:MAG: DUF3179 domain-containing protein, partial [Chloroflexi bacterium]|nr:DUF3179 domain-containing protein [Chloroflexota bacterium]